MSNLQTNDSLVSSEESEARIGSSELRGRNPIARNGVRSLLYASFLAVVCLFCYLQPLPDDFDRYMYEAIVRGRHQPVEIVYSLVKHESPRAESSSILDSPDHMAKLEPLYAIRPAYIWLVALISDAGLPVQHAINLISAASLFGIGMLIFAWTGCALPSALLLAAAPILVLGRMGTPDALSTLIVLTGLWAITTGHLYGIVLLLLSVWVRTDNLLLILLVLLWLVGSRKLSSRLAVVLSIAAVGSVLVVNHLASNYGWLVLFRWSFLGGYRSPADVPPHLSFREYASVFVHSLEHIFSYVAIWLLIGLTAWRRSPSSRPLLTVVGLAATFHFLLYPSPEDRYLTWAYLVAGAAFIKSMLAQRTFRDDGPNAVRC